MPEDRPNLLDGSVRRLQRAYGSARSYAEHAISPIGAKLTRLGSNRLLVIVVVAVFLFGFAPISHVLLRAVNGSFAPSAYSSLALNSPSEVTRGVKTGSVVRVTLVNHTPQEKTYRWSATQDGSLISLGTETVQRDESTVIRVPTRGALAGPMKITLTGSNVFVTVPVRGS
jgi:hypothetical protein